MLKFLALIATVAVASALGGAVGAAIVLPIAEAPAATTPKEYQPHNFICA